MRLLFLIGQKFILLIVFVPISCVPFLIKLPSFDFDEWSTGLELCFALIFFPQLFPDYRFNWLITEFRETISSELGLCIPLVILCVLDLLDRYMKNSCNFFIACILHISITIISSSDQIHWRKCQQQSAEAHALWWGWPLKSSKWCRMVQGLVVWSRIIFLILRCLFEKLLQYNTI